MQISAVSLQYVQSGQTRAQTNPAPPPPVLPEREADSVEFSRRGTPIFSPGEEPQDPAVPGGSVDSIDLDHRDRRGHSVDIDHEDHHGPGDGPGRRVGPRFANDDPSLSGRRHHDGHHDHGRRVGPPTIGAVNDETGAGQTVNPAPEPVDPGANADPGALGAGDSLTGSGNTVDPQPEPVEPSGTAAPSSIGGDPTSDGTPDGHMSMSFGESFGSAEFRLGFDGEVTSEALRWFRQGMANEVERFVEAAGMSDTQRQDFVQAYWDFAHDLRSLIESREAHPSELAEKFHGLFDAFTARASDVLAGGVVDANPIDTGATGLVLDLSA